MAPFRMSITLSPLPLGSVDPLPKLDSANAVRDAVGQLIADVYAGRLDPRVATGLAPLLNLQLRAIGTTDVEQFARRLSEVEKQLAEVLSEAGVGGDLDAKA